MVRSGVDANDVLAALAEKYDLSADQVGVLLELLPETAAAMDRQKEATQDLAEEQRGLANAIGEAVAAMQGQADQLRAQIDPVFAYHKAVESAEAAQEAYNEAVNQFGPDSQEARTAAFELALAALDVQNSAAGGRTSREGGAERGPAPRTLAGPRHPTRVAGVAGRRHQAVVTVAADDRELAEVFIW